MLSKLIGKIVLAVVILAAGYIGFRMIVFKESFMEALGTAQEQAKEHLDEHALKKLTPMERGDYYFGREKFDKAAEEYTAATKRAAAADATPEEQLSGDKLQTAYRRIGDSWYEQAKKTNWEPGAVREAIRAYKDYADRFPHRDDKIQVSNRVTELEQQ